MATRKPNPEATKLLSSSFDRLPNDCKVNAFSFLGVKDMNTVATCSKDCLVARNNHSLNQERIGTIIATKKTTVRSFGNTIRSAELNNVFSHNCTHLRMEGVNHINSEMVEDLPELTGVTKLDLSLPDDKPQDVDDDVVSALVEMCPNATELDMSKILSGVVVGMSRSTTVRLTWNGCNVKILWGPRLFRSELLTELYMDNATFTTYYSLEESEIIYGHDAVDAHRIFLLKNCRNIQRLSIRNATLLSHGSEGEGYEEVKLPESFIIKFVRYHSTLRWLCSDLSAKNVAILKKERPEISFVS